MEFYDTRRMLRLRLRRVSIPNGMEFYTEALAKNIADECRFNSQRDGILPDVKTKREIKKLFQFPTGWNSTIITLIFARAKLAFQFPTGWNSTVLPLCLETASGGFNSQRDGILQTRVTASGAFVNSFNSQRDGILLRDIYQAS